jgi:hypothetical protein
MKARGRAVPLAVPALAAAVLALAVPKMRLAPSYRDTAPGGGAPWRVVLQADLLHPPDVQLQVRPPRGE